MRGESLAGVTLSIVSHGQRSLLEPLLRDLAAIRPPTVTALMLTLNLPEDEPEGIAALPWPVTVLRNGLPRGFGANHNQAFSFCATPFFAVLNPDLRLQADPFPALLDSMGPSVGAAAPAIRNTDGTMAPSARPLYTPVEVVARKLGLASKIPQEPDWIAGTFMLLRSEAFAAVNGFDERFHMYVEDVDLCARLRLAGWHVAVTGDASVVHAAQYASHRSLDHMSWHARSMLRFWTSRVFWRYWALLRTNRTAVLSGRFGQ